MLVLISKIFMYKLEVKKYTSINKTVSQPQIVSGNRTTEIKVIEYFRDICVVSHKLRVTVTRGFQK